MGVFYTVIKILGGLAMFLYGMRLMGDGLKSGSGGALKAVLARVTNRAWMAFLLGLLVTCMIQSSTATIVLTVGLVGAGFLTFRQSVGIVLGANVGTAITAQIIRLMDLQASDGSLLLFFKSENLAPLALTVGIILIMFVHRQSAGTVGKIFIGFGTLFVGLMNMSAAVSGLSGTLSNLLVSFGNNPPLGFLSGVLVTGVIQSSSAVIGILQSVASSLYGSTADSVQFFEVFAVIVGVNIGDCLTTYLVCRIGARREQIRVCFVHIIYNVIAALLIFATIAVLRVTGVLNDGIWKMELDSGGVANIHGLFRLAPAVLLLPFSGLLARLAERLLPDKPMDEEDAEIEMNLRELDMHLVNNPTLALEESGQLIGNMAAVALKNCTSAFNQLEEFHEKRDGKINHREELLDRMADASNQYLIAIAPHVTRKKDSNTLNFYLRALVCFERIGDLAVDINKCAVKLNDAKDPLSDDAKAELSVAVTAVTDILQMTVNAFNESSVALAQKIEPLEEVIDELIKELQSRHVDRMTHKRCSGVRGIEYQNILTYLERLSDQCSDLAVYLLGRYDYAIGGQEHQYIYDLHHTENPAFRAAFSENRKKYFALLDAQQ